MGKNLYDKVFDAHLVREIEPGQYQLFMGLHLVHEVTSPQAFSMLREAGYSVLHPERTFATSDHVIPTSGPDFASDENRQMVQSLEKNTGDFKIRYFSPQNQEHGIVHVIGPEYGITQPGMTVCCGDSHTSTHGAFGAVAFGIGSSQVRDVLATQTMVTGKLKVRKIHVNGSLGAGVYAKDLALYIINRLGTRAGVGYAYEFAGPAIEALSMDERMTLCNLSVEAGARCGYINPDQVTFDFLKGKPFAPAESDWNRAVDYWKSMASDDDASFDDVVKFDANDVEPMVTYGITPAQSVSIQGVLPPANDASLQEAMEYMKFQPGQKIQGQKIQVAFIGSCTNGRYSDFKEVADLLVRGDFRVSPDVQALVVPGSHAIYKRMKSEGMDRIFEHAGFEFRTTGCSMCLAMNGDQLEGDQVCASSSNRNFKGRQGSPTGRTLLMSPAMVAASAIAGEVADPRHVFSI
ncbi:MAG TPA: 3-isopropylmalate dehydratase large subunit [Leptospiraceae bacterium]|nr:3-isopropylmalate dehydratase large subunit [Spirochaetaceae bacterium]HBS03822.1 3-isopropylmalate dehydratase large subunit [Leptospiraceae bacterium]